VGVIPGRIRRPSVNPLAAPTARVSLLRNPDNHPHKRLDGIYQVGSHRRLCGAPTTFFAAGSNSKVGKTSVGHPPPNTFFAAGSNSKVGKTSVGHPPGDPSNVFRVKRSNGLQKITFIE
jgi:hypothetical protein